MVFGNKRNYRHTYHRIPGFVQAKKSGGYWKIAIWIALVFVFLPISIGFLWFYKNILRDLPQVSEIENFDFKQATTITDRDGVVLYTLFEENRQYVPYDKISKNFINALVATEDQRFWSNPGIDRKGTLRAIFTDITQGKTHGASTLTQQLIKNLMLTPEKKIERKLKEIVLAIKLNKYISNDIRKKHKNLSDKEIEKKMKEKILELYANYIFLGNNSYGVEVASRNYFDKNASELSILEGAILAGIPQAPSRYDPYTRRDLLMGSLSIKNSIGENITLDNTGMQLLLQHIRDIINNVNITFKRDDTAIINYLKGLLSFAWDYNGDQYQIDYIPGRKDAVLARMYEEKYITEMEFKKNFLYGFDYVFQRGSVEMQAPHFVFWIIRLLEQEYDEDLLRRGGLTITTTLDKEIQDFAEQSIQENSDHLKSYHVSNAAMLYIDSQNGDVLAYVGSRDYYNSDIDGQVDIIQAKRQPGSIIKPLIYALGFMRLSLTIDSPIYDIPFVLGNNRPSNADGEFWGLIPLKNALAGSRNIPAIKIFLALGGEEKVKEFLQKLGLKSLSSEKNYGYPLAIGAGEVPMIEMANAYMHLSAMGKPAQINPIKEIRTSDGSLLYQKDIVTQEQIIPAGVAYLIRDILSDKNNFPHSWQKTFSYPKIRFATKSGTTNIKQGEEKLPRDGRFVAYTPEKVMIFWGGNTDGSPLKKDAYGGWINSPLRKTFVKKLEDKGYIQNIAMSPREIGTVNISKISGKLASYETPLALIEKSLGYIQTLPVQTDDSIEKIKIDILCNGKPNELTPLEDIQNAYRILPSAFLLGYSELENIMERRRDEGLKKYEKEFETPLFLDALTGDCQERYSLAELGEISLSVLQPTPGSQVTRQFAILHQTKSPFIIRNMKIFLDDIMLKTLHYQKAGTLIDITNIKIPQEIETGKYMLKLVVLDDKGYSDTVSFPIYITENDFDTKAPYVLADKVKVKKNKNEGGYDVVVMFADDSSLVVSGSLFQGDAKYVLRKNSNLAIFNVPSLDNIVYEVRDSSGNQGEGEIVLRQYYRND